MSLQRELRRACGSARGSDGRDADRLGDVRRSAVGECRCNTNDLPRVLLDEGCPVEPGPRPGAEPDHEQLVESEAGGLVDPVVVGLEQSFPVADDGVVHGVPVTPELCSHFVHAAGVLAHLSGRPPSSPGGEELSRSGDPVVLFGPAAHRTVTVRAHPPALPPHQPARTTCSGRSTSSTRVRSFTWASTPHDGQPADRATVSTWIFATPPGPSSTPRKVMSGSPIIPQQRALRVSLHGGPPSSVFEQPKIGGPPLRARGSSCYTPLNSEVPSMTGNTTCTTHPNNSADPAAHLLVRGRRARRRIDGAQQCALPPWACRAAQTDRPAVCLAGDESDRGQVALDRCSLLAGEPPLGSFGWRCNRVVRGLERSIDLDRTEGPYEMLNGPLRIVRFRKHA